jgi:DNA N-6-adenine-methyltransferase (Dam)
MGEGRTLHLAATTKETERWLTPRWVLDALGPFDLDPCGAPGWPTAARILTPEAGDDGLVDQWSGRVWLNPPYGREAVRWLERLADHGDGIALIFARTDTAAFHEQVWGRADAVLFIRGRLTFLRPDGTAPVANSGAPSCLVAYGASAADDLARADIPGRLVRLTEAAA